MPASTPTISSTELALHSKMIDPSSLSLGDKSQLRLVLRLFPDETGADGSDVCQITLALMAAERKRTPANEMLRPLTQGHADGNLSFEDFIRTVGQLVGLDPASIPTLPDPPMSARLPDDEQPARTAEEITVEKLSQREMDVLKLVMVGDSNKHIARKLQIAEPTVKCHVKSILRKLNARNRFEAAMLAMKMKPRFRDPN